MRLTGERLEQLIQGLNKMSGYGDYLEALTELQSARKVVEAASKVVEDAQAVGRNPIRVTIGIMDELTSALTAHDESGPNPFHTRSEKR